MGRSLKVGDFVNDGDESDFWSSPWQSDRCRSVDFANLAPGNVEFCDQLQSDMVVATRLTGSF